MSATESLRHDELVARARQITTRELQVYMQRTAGSQRATERARIARVTNLQRTLMTLELDQPTLLKLPAPPESVTICAAEFGA